MYMYQTIYDAFLECLHNNQRCEKTYCGSDVLSCIFKQIGGVCTRMMNRVKNNMNNGGEENKNDKR